MFRVFRKRAAHHASTHAIADLLSVHSGEKLLSTPDRQAHLRELARLVAVPEAHFDALYRAAVLRFARYVQLLPASESHHHACAGGLLDHTLEVLIEALKQRRAYMLPPGAKPEEVRRKEDLWTYAATLSALLHDVGKAAALQRVVLMDASARERGDWDPYAGAMPDRAFYRIEFLRDRSYPLHTRVAPLLARYVVPDLGMTWLASDRQVLSCWLAAISGDHETAGVLGQLVQTADGASTARNLGAQTPRMSAARSKPLHEKLLTSLRYLIAEGQLPLNRNGAAGWLVGDDLWLVSKRVADALREQLQVEGHEGIPTRNDRIFDVLQEHRLLIANGEHAIWRARVLGQDWDNAHDLTLLRMPAFHVWPNPQSRPTPFTGTVSPLAGAPVDDERASAADPNSIESEAFAAAHATSSVPPDAVASQSESPVEFTNQPSTSGNKNNRYGGSPFFSWLMQGLREGTIASNQPDARVHRTPEGVLLVSPALFRDYGRSLGDESHWEHAQKRTLKLKLHKTTPAKTNIHHYRVELPDGNYTGSAKVIKGILIAAPDCDQLFPGAAPTPNPVLHRIDPVGKNA
jgi:integrating conjugative element relaxase (TIGR03760 family)